MEPPPGVPPGPAGSKPAVRGTPRGRRFRCRIVSGIPGRNRTSACSFAGSHAESTTPPGRIPGRNRTSISRFGAARAEVHCTTGTNIGYPRQEPPLDLLFRRQPGVCYPTGALVWSGTRDLHPAAPGSRPGGALSPPVPVGAEGAAPSAGGHLPPTTRIRRRPSLEDAPFPSIHAPFVFSNGSGLTAIRITQISPIRVETARLRFHRLFLCFCNRHLICEIPARSVPS